MLLIIASILVAIIVLVVVIASNRPDTFRIERRITINAVPEKVFLFINDFQKWKLWSPWEKMDPTMNRHYSGNESDIGSLYEWNGNKKVGQGRMEIVDATEAKRIFILLEFIKPFAAKNTTEFMLQPHSEGTQVIWAMEGKHPLMAKIMCLFMNMDKLVGKDFEEGLRNLQSVATE